MFNCQFFLAAQCNPHIVPFFHNSKGDVGRPSRWSRGMRQDSWRGGFLLAALELYLKSDMRAKFHFLKYVVRDYFDSIRIVAVSWCLLLTEPLLHSSLLFSDLEAAVGFTSTMMTQVYGGTTTIVPQISIFDYFKVNVMAVNISCCPLLLAQFLCSLHFLFPFSFSQIQRYRS